MAEQIERNSLWDGKDAANGTALFYTYLLEVDGGADYYAGHTDDLKARLAEHALGNTASIGGRPVRLVWFDCHATREAAAKQEARMKRAVKRNPERVKPFCQTFRDLCALVAPRPTLEELERESRERESLMSRSMHKNTGMGYYGQSPALCLWMPKQWPPKVYATDNWQAVTCPDCLAKGGMERIPETPAKVVMQGAAQRGEV